MSSSILSAKGIGSIEWYLGYSVDAIRWHSSGAKRSYLLAGCIVKMGFLFQLYANRGHILSWKFINTMRCHIFVKQAANGSLNDAGLWSIERSQTEPFNNQYCLPLAHHYESKSRNQKKLKQNFKKSKHFFNLTRTWLVTRTSLGLGLDSCYE